MLADRVHVAIFLKPDKSLRRAIQDDGLEQIERSLIVAEMHHAAAEVVAEVAVGQIALDRHAKHPEVVRGGGCSTMSPK